ncbi:MAG: type II secretion system protein M [Gammaproteobacteria bacterium]|nr:type II secretion system protein M [Gammaproteobacteria bacterium]
MKAYWQQLSERDQMAAMVGGVCLVLYLLYALVFEPLSSSVTAAQEAWTEKKATLNWMQHVEKTYVSAKKPQTVTAGNLLSILTTRLNKTSFHRFPHQLSQTATGDIQLTFDQVPYNLFILWLQRQSTEYTLIIKSLDMTKTDVSGIVKAAVMFSAPEQ